MFSKRVSKLVSNHLLGSQHMLQNYPGALAWTLRGLGNFHRNGAEDLRTFAWKHIPHAHPVQRSFRVAFTVLSQVGRLLQDEADFIDKLDAHKPSPMTEQSDQPH